MSYLQSYLDRIREQGREELAEAIRKTATDISSQYISNFSFMDHVVGLLVGDIQSGKTSHMFGLICAAADESFMNFILLTTDNVLLQKQTYQRALQDLSDFCVCDENDLIKFQANNLRKPAIIILKKNSSVLKQWRNNLSSTNFCTGNPLFILDDEADAASLNTQINQKKQSTINKQLEAIKKTTSSSVYVEVTATPQSILLQTVESGWKPYFTYYFKPGRGYIGGNFLFSDPPPPNIVFTNNEEAENLLDEDEFSENGLKTALVTHLISAAHLLLNGAQVCNFLIHPSVKTELHSYFANKIGNYLNEILYSKDEEETRVSFEKVYLALKSTKKNLLPFSQIYDFISEQLSCDKVSTLTLNSVSPYSNSELYQTGINIIIGGNSLGRGVTFPKLQTIYYCRVSKNPQADTMWQHARMFGYDRDIGLLRIFLPPKLFKLFSDINRTNNSIVGQIERSGNERDIKIFYPKNLKPTRKNVLDKNAVHVYSGGVNYFPLYPINKDIPTLDALLSSFNDGVYSVSLKLVEKITEHLGSELTCDWDSKAFTGFINSFSATNPAAQGTLIVRRNRDIGRGTGTLLSPNDRALGDEYKDCVVLTLYKITGNKDKGWDGSQIWIPNIKLPGDCAYYTGK